MAIIVGNTHTHTHTNTHTRTHAHTQTLTHARTHKHTHMLPLFHACILVNTDGVVRLCDFGSCTCDVIDPSALDYRGKMAAAERLESVSVSFAPSAA